MSIRTEVVRFPGSLGVELAGRLSVPTEGEPRRTALYAHCFTCSKDFGAAAPLARALGAHGISVLRFDFTGLGQSGGEFSETSFSSNVADLEAAVAWLRAHHRAPEILIGHSLGGAAALAVAGQLPEVKAVVTINAPAEPAHLDHLFACALPQIQSDGQAKVEIAGRPFTIKKAFLDDIKGTRLAPKIAALGAALLVLHSPQDEVVELEQATRIFLAARYPKSFVSLDGADHLLSGPGDAEYVAAVTAAWVERHL